MVLASLRAWSLQSNLEAARFKATALTADLMMSFAVYRKVRLCKYLKLELNAITYLETGRQWIVLHDELDFITWFQQLHDCFLMRGLCHFRAVHF